MSALRVVAPVARVAAARKTVVRAADSDVTARLEDALKIAEECVDECAAMWDEVEELSQAASDKKPAPAEMDPVPISEKDMNFIKETQAALAAAKKGAESVDVDTLRSLESAAASAKKVTVSNARLDPMSKRNYESPW